jgi:hypothetical protein
VWYQLTFVACDEIKKGMKAVEYLRMGRQSSPKIIKLLFGVGENWRAHKARFDDDDLYQRSAPALLCLF